MLHQKGLVRSSTNFSTASVKSGHHAVTRPCPLYPRKRTLSELADGAKAPANIYSGSEDCLGDHPQRLRVGVAAEQHAIDVPLFPRILPSLQPVTNAISRTDERNLIDQSIGYSGYRLRLAADEESILDPNCRRLVPHALCSVIVEILVAGAHAADIEGKVLLDR